MSHKTIPCTPFAPGSLYRTTLIDVTPGDSIAFTSKRVDKFLCFHDKQRNVLSKKEERFIWKHNIGPNQTFDRWDYIFYNMKHNG